MTNNHQTTTKTEREIREALPELSDKNVQRLRFLAVLKRAVEKELAEGSPTDSRGVKKVFMNMAEIVDAHVATIAYYMGLSSMSDDPESIIAFSLEIAGQLVSEIHGARQAYKRHLASGHDCGFEIIDANLMGPGSNARN